MQRPSALVDRLSGFALLWAMATLIHQASFTGWISERWPLGWALTGLATLVVIWPRSISLFATMVAISAMYTTQRLPSIPNHILFELFVNLTILGGLGLGWLEARRQGLQGKEARERIYSAFASTVRFEVLLLYFFVTLHKLNRDFFDPEVSCGGTLFNMMVDNAPVLAESSLVQIGCIAATLLFEAGIPVLLMFQRTRALGIVVGFFFHLVIGFVPHGGVYSFSALMMALFFLFIPAQSVQGLGDMAERLLTRLSIPRAGAVYRILAMAGVTATVAVWVWGWHRAGHLSMAKVGFAQWLAWSAILLFAFLAAVRSNTVPWTSFQVAIWPARPVLWLFPLLITLNGFSPYLGSKTQTSFAMFSNLRTENGRSNHLFLAGVPQIWSYQRDIVTIVRSDQYVFERLRQKDLQLPYFEFQTHLSNIEDDLEVVFLLNGEPRKVERVDGQLSADSEPLDPGSSIERKWLRFRPFDAGPKMRCRH